MMANITRYVGDHYTLCRQSLHVMFFPCSGGLAKRGTSRWQSSGLLADTGVFSYTLFRVFVYRFSLFSLTYVKKYSLLSKKKKTFSLCIAKKAVPLQPICEIMTSVSEKTT